MCRRAGVKATLTAPPAVLLGRSLQALKIYREAAVTEKREQKLEPENVHALVGIFHDLLVCKFFVSIISADINRALLVVKGQFLP